MPDFSSAKYCLTSDFAVATAFHANSDHIQPLRVAINGFGRIGRCSGRPHECQRREPRPEREERPWLRHRVVDVQVVQARVVPMNVHPLDQRRKLADVETGVEPGSVAGV